MLPSTFTASCGDVDGSYTTLVVGGAMRTRGEGINNAGQIVGSYDDAGGKTHGYLATSSGP